MTRLKPEEKKKPERQHLIHFRRKGRQRDAIPAWGAPRHTEPQETESQSLL